jgi:hypothetical protein
MGWHLPSNFYGLRKDRFHSDDAFKETFLCVPESDQQRVMKSAQKTDRTEERPRTLSSVEFDNFSNVNMASVSAVVESSRTNRTHISCTSERSHSAN